MRVNFNQSATFSVGKQRGHFKQPATFSLGDNLNQLATFCLWKQPGQFRLNGTFSVAKHAVNFSQSVHSPLGSRLDNLNQCNSPFEAAFTSLGNTQVFSFTSRRPASLCHGLLSVVSPWCVRPSVSPSVRPSVRSLTFSLNIFSEITYRILMKFHRNVPAMVLFRIS